MADRDMIREIAIENYKSIQTLILNLGRVTVLIGENGSGKSNILEAVALSSAAANDKLDNEFLVSRGLRVIEDAMTTFGLITKGKTDQIVIENILVGYFQNLDIVVNWLLPLRDETDKHRAENFSNWSKVFEYCHSQTFKEAFPYNDYIIIQIDTDVSEEKGYDIPKYEAGQELTPEALIARVIDKFKGLMSEVFYQGYQARIIFAIAVHSIECWLLPLYYTNKMKAKTKNCLDTLNQQLQKVENFRINPLRKNLAIMRLSLGHIVNIKPCCNDIRRTQV